MAMQKAEARRRRKVRIRTRIKGTPERPRLSVFRSNRYLYVQVIDDESGCTLASASTLEKDVRAELSTLKKLEQAKKIGAVVAKKCLDKGINKVVFDRGGYMYHGRVLALADAARKAGLKF